MLWLDGGDSNTLFSNADGSGGNSTVGGAVRRWKDKSGQSNDFSNQSASGRFPTYASGGGVFLSNAGSPIYNVNTFNCLRSVTSNLLAFPYYTVYTVVNATVSSSITLPLLFACVRRPDGESRNPNFGLGGSFCLGGPNVWTGSSTNARSTMGDYVGNSAGEQISSGVTTVAGLISGRLSNTTSVAGTRVSSGGSLFYVPWTTCTAPCFIGGAFYLVTANTPDNRFLNGTIFETLVFNSELTRGQCEEIEGYLSWKWGRQTALPTTHPFRNIAPLARGFTPIDIPGCALWLDAYDATTLTLSGSNVTQWRDKSGNAYHAVGYNNAATYDATGLNSRPALAFSSTKSMVAPVPAGTFPAAVSVFVVYQFSGAVSSSAVYTIINRTFSQVNNFAAPFSAYQNNGSIARYIGNGTTNGNQRYEFTAGTTYTNTTPTLYYFNVASNANTTWNESVNGTPTAYTLTLGTAAYGDTASNVCIGGRLDTAVFMNGFISEVIMYNTTLTIVQRQAVEGYLAHKWGLTTTLSASNSLRAIPPSSVQQFKPTDINACSLWLDAADLTGSTISTWNDKSGNGSNATANSAITILANAVNGNNVLSVTSGTARYLNGSIAITGTGLTVISAFRMDSGSSNSAHTIGLGVSGANDTANISYLGICRQSGSSNMGPNRNGSYAGPLLTYAVPVISTTYFDGANGFSYINGGTASSFASTANFGITSYTIMANTSNADSTSYFTGYMCEMIVYNSTLTLAQRQQVEGYLSGKWAIPLATAHPYYAINPPQMVGATAIITPSNLPGLIVWNRGDTLAVGNGNTINAWTNSSNASGPTINCTGTQSNAALNGLSVANLTTAQTWTSATTLDPSNYTFIQVSRQYPGTYGRMFQSSVTSTNQLHGYWNSLKQPWYVEGWLGVAGGGINSDQNEWAIITSTRIRNGAFQNRWNGAVIASGSSSANVTLNGLTVNGGSALGSNEKSTCQIAEVILYSNVLTNPQIIGIEEYLRQKWGLQMN